MSKLELRKSGKKLKKIKYYRLYKCRYSWLGVMADNPAVGDPYHYDDMK